MHLSAKPFSCGQYGTATKCLCSSKAAKSSDNLGVNFDAQFPWVPENTQPLDLSSDKFLRYRSHRWMNNKFTEVFNDENDKKESIFFWKWNQSIH